jgi:hypothetical protein
VVGPGSDAPVSFSGQNRPSETNSRPNTTSAMAQTFRITRNAAGGMIFRPAPTAAATKVNQTKSERTCPT